jgi:hypothetical protein
LNFLDKINLFSKGGSQIRLLLNGRLLQDTQNLDDIKFEAGSIITAFISPKVKFDPASDEEEEKNGEGNKRDDLNRQEGDSHRELTNSESQNPLNIVRGSDERGFDLFKSRGYSVSFHLSCF